MCLGKLGVVTKVWDDDGIRMALVDVGSAIETACVIEQPDLHTGASVLVHLGFVVEILDPMSAQEAMHLRSLGTQGVT
jgi:hydrogenase maturation factor